VVYPVCTDLKPVCTDLKMNIDVQKMNEVFDFSFYFMVYDLFI
jgi:hypothetical protein